jgi:hypothetical protein
MSSTLLLPKKPLLGLRLHSARSLESDVDYIKAKRNTHKVEDSIISFNKLKPCPTPDHKPELLASASNIHAEIHLR